MDPLEVAIESTIIEETSAGVCPGCRFDSLESLVVVVSVAGMPQEVVRVAACGRCGYEAGL